MVLYAVVEWGTTSSLDLDTLTDGVISGTHLADCPDRDEAQRIAHLLAEDARDRAPDDNRGVGRLRGRTIRPEC